MPWVILGVIVLLILFLVGIYNRLVTSRNGYKNAFAQIDVQLKRRYDLIPNLVETAKGYLSHERMTLEAVMAARNAAQSAARSAAAHPGDAQAMIARKNRSTSQRDSRRVSACRLKKSMSVQPAGWIR